MKTVRYRGALGHTRWRAEDWHEGCGLHEVRDPVEANAGYGDVNGLPPSCLSILPSGNQQALAWKIMHVTNSQ
jgi:hypothetical protein